jgi:hypothetical protein
MKKARAEYIALALHKMLDVPMTRDEASNLAQFLIASGKAPKP